MSNYAEMIEKSVGAGFFQNGMLEWKYARVVKLVYTYALGAYVARRAGSSPVSGTKIFPKLLVEEYLGIFSYWVCVMRRDSHALSIFKLNYCLLHQNAGNISGNSRF